MFGRATFIKAKTGYKAELARTLEQEAIPLFRNEEGFRGLFALVMPNGREAFSISLWDHKANAQANCEKSIGSQMAWRAWSWQLNWLKSRKYQMPISAP